MNDPYKTILMRIGLSYIIILILKSVKLSTYKGFLQKIKPQNTLLQFALEDSGEKIHQLFTSMSGTDLQIQHIVSV